MTIEITKGSENPVTDFFSSTSNTPETDECGSHEGNWDTKFFRMQFHARNLERQRDEARTTIEDAKRALNANDYEGILLAALRVKEERDEAREALMKIEDLFVDGEDTHDDWMKMGNIAKDYLKGLE
jgi:hypothetical protein